MDGRVVEKRVRVFDYSNNTILSIVEWKTRAKEEIKRIKNLPSSSSSWVKVNRGDKTSHQEIFDDADLNQIPRVGGGLVKKLVGNGITQVKKLKNLHSGRIELLVVRGIRRTILAIPSNRANAASPRLYPNPVTDHRNDDNLYKNCFGADHYSKLANCAALSPFVCIEKLVLHIVFETKRLMKGTIHEHDCFFIMMYCR